MTQHYTTFTKNMKELNEQELLTIFKCITARLPYGIKVNWQGAPYLVEAVNRNMTVKLEGVDEWIPIAEVRPYLNGLTSLSEKISDEISDANLADGLFYLNNRDKLSGVYLHTNFLDVLNRNHLDYRQMVPAGIAYDSTKIKNIYE